MREKIDAVGGDGLGDIEVGKLILGDMDDFLGGDVG